MPTLGAAHQSQIDLPKTQQIASIAFDYTLLASSKAGLGQHLWNISLIAYPKVAQVSHLHLFPHDTQMIITPDTRSLAGP